MQSMLRWKLLKIRKRIWRRKRPRSLMGVIVICIGGFAVEDQIIGYERGMKKSTAFYSESSSSYGC